MRRVRFISAERDRVHAGLQAAGITVPSSQGNFLWLPVSDPVGFAADCESRGVLVRAVRGLGVRATVGLPAANDHLLDAARTVALHTPHPPATRR
jgi:histidinol-phosphate aminotransferase